MITNSTRAQRRQSLYNLVKKPIILFGNGHQSRNIPMNALPFRQDSTFLYLTNCKEPNAAVLITEHEEILFLAEKPEGDALWHGKTPSNEELAKALGFEITKPIAQVNEFVPQDAATLAASDPSANKRAQHWSSEALVFGRQFGDPTLVKAIIDLRRVKSTDEIAEIEMACNVTSQAFKQALCATHPDYNEAGLFGLFQSVIALAGCTTGYDTILSQDGDVLHNHSHNKLLQSGRLVLCDGGAELKSGYGADITRTWPVNGAFSPLQRDVYEAVLAAQKAAIKRCVPGTWFSEVQQEASKVICQFLVDDGLLQGDVTGLVERGAHALFFPHGVGHHLGLDVHDLENFGDLPSYRPNVGRPKQFGACYLRLDLPLEPNWVVTVEPGFYVVDAILNDPHLAETFRRDLNRERLEAYRGLGGIRIEDDIAITSTQPRVLSKQTPKEICELEALIGTNEAFEKRLWQV